MISRALYIHLFYSRFKFYVREINELVCSNNVGTNFTSGEGTAPPVLAENTKSIRSTSNYYFFFHLYFHARLLFLLFRC